MLDDFVSDYYTVYAIRKKQKEQKRSVRRTVSEYSRYDNNIFDNLLKNKN